MQVYLSHPISRSDQVDKILERLTSALPNVKFIRPILVDCKHHEYFYADVKLLLESDVLLVYAPEVTIGVPCELAIFKTKKPFCLAIGYKCVKHGWFDRLLDYQFDFLDDVIQVLSNVNNCLTRVT